VLFEFDRAVLRDAEGDKLERLLAGPRAKALRIDAVGHADRIGPAAYNLRLSQRRADAVKSYLLKKKEIGPAAVRTSARGELEPASGDACVGMGAEIRRNLGLVECLQPDRRVEVSIDREK
jgi:OOP family OmpA-OmpF porin